MRTVFVVEDDPAVRGLLERALAEAYQVRAFATGRDALNALQVFPPDVLLTDLELPGVGGEDLAWAAGHLEPRPRVVIMSGDSRRLSRAAHLAQATVEKPFAIASLRHLIEPPEPLSGS